MAKETDFTFSLTHATALLIQRERQHIECLGARFPGDLYWRCVICLPRGEKIPDKLFISKPLFESGDDALEATQNARAAVLRYMDEHHENESEPETPAEQIWFSCMAVIAEDCRQSSA